MTHRIPHWRRDAGFIIAKVLDNPDGVTIITAGKGDESYGLQSKNIRTPVEYAG